LCDSLIPFPVLYPVELFGQLVIPLETLIRQVCHRIGSRAALRGIEVGFGSCLVSSGEIDFECKLTGVVESMEIGLKLDLDQQHLVE
jgi:hypothetical protein